MALRYSGSNVGVVLLLYCFHAVSFPSHGQNNSLKLELELAQSHMAQKPMMRGEVGARMREMPPQTKYPPHTS